MDWYKMSAREVLDELSADDKKGLAPEDAEKRLDKYGTNELQEEEGKSFAKKLAEQFLDPMIIILLIAAIFPAPWAKWWTPSLFSPSSS